MSVTNQNYIKMKVKIMQRSVYHKYAEVEIEIPNDWNDKNGVDRDWETDLCIILTFILI